MSFVTMELAREIENDRTLEQLTNKIKKIIPEIEEEFEENVNMVQEVFGGILQTSEKTGRRNIYQRPITLEDILRCLEERVDWIKIGFLSIDTRGNFYSSKPDCEDKLDIKWQLGKPLHEQSEETIKELNNLI